MKRLSQISRKTNETNINLKINLDGNGTSVVKTEVGFLNHMISLLAFHSNIDIESNLITKDNVEQIWKYIRKKNEITAKIFYLFFVMDLPIKTIANDMKMTESSVKNHLYRTQKELKKYLRKEKLNNAG